jgi:hypothetical protein
VAVLRKTTTLQRSGESLADQFAKVEAISDKRLLDQENAQEGVAHLSLRQETRQADALLLALRTQDLLQLDKTVPAHEARAEAAETARLRSVLKSGAHALKMTPHSAGKCQDLKVVLPHDGLELQEGETDVYVAPSVHALLSGVEPGRLQIVDLGAIDCRSRRQGYIHYRTRGGNKRWRSIKKV